MQRKKHDYINYRLERADEALRDAMLMLKNDSLYSAVNRLYYAAFYTVLALLRINDNIPKTHKGVKVLFNKDFIQTEIIPREYSYIYSKLFNWRQESDYGDFPEINKEQITELYFLTKDLIAYLKNYIKQNIN